MTKSLLALAGALALAACAEKAPPPAPRVAEVSFITVTPRTVTLTTELPGRTAAFETSEVRPQVNGLIRARLFEEGNYVRAGQPLYRIDSAPYEAQLASARAAYARARAAIASSQALARRYGELVKINAIAAQEAENAVTGAQQAQAELAAQQAAVRAAEIDLARTTITAPITGRIGRSTYTTGALVTAAQTDPLTVIQRLDPIFVDISQSSTEVLRLRQRILAGELSRAGGAARVRLALEDGSIYPAEGRLQFTDVTVDPTTGSQTIRAVFPNRQGLLLPGMFVRAELIEGTQPDALLVPQQAVSRDERGRPVAMVVGAGNRVESRALTAPRTVGGDWLVTAGLKAGDRVIVERGIQLMPGATVRPRPYAARAGATPAATAAGSAS